MKIKKIGVLLFILTIVTIGGVYATWSFAGQKVDSVEQGIQMGITSATVSTQRGEYNIEISHSGELFSVDQESTESHKAVLKIAEDAKVIIRFTPNVGVSKEISDNGLLTNFNFVVESEKQYTVDEKGNYSLDGQAKSIFNLDTEIKTLRPVGDLITTNEYNWVKQENGSFTYELDNNALSQIITINEFIIDTISEYEEFSTCVKATSFKLIVSDPTPSDKE